MELRVERVEKNYDNFMAVRYHDETAGRVYVVYGGCIFSMRTSGRGAHVTVFGYRLRSPAMCALVNSELTQSGRSVCAETLAPGPEFLFTHHLGAASGDAPEDMVNSFEVNVRGLVLSKMFVGFPVPDGIELQLGDVDRATGALRIFAKPKAVNSVTGFEYQIDTGSMDLTQAELSEVPPFLADDLSDLLASADLRRNPLRESLPRTPVMVTGERSLSTITVPVAGCRGGAARRSRRKKVATVADHVQIKTFGDDEEEDDDAAANCGSGDDADEVDGFGGYYVPSGGVDHSRVWKVVSLIEGALEVRKGPLSWLGLGNKNPTDNLRAVLKEEARTVCANLGPWTEIIGRSILRPSPEMIYASVNYLLELGGYQNKFGIMEDLCNKYAAKHGINIQEECPLNEEMVLIEELALGIMRKVAVVREVLCFTVKEESYSPAAREARVPKRYICEGISLAPEASFLLNATRLNSFGTARVAEHGRESPTRPLSRKALARTDKKVAAVMACVYAEPQPAQHVAQIFGRDDVMMALESARLNVVNPWDKDDIAESLAVLDSIVNFRLA